MPEAAAQKVRALLGLPATDPIDPARLAEAAAALIDLATNLEPIVWKVLNRSIPAPRAARTSRRVSGRSSPATRTSPC